MQGSAVHGAVLFECKCYDELKKETNTRRSAIAF